MFSIKGIKAGSVGNLSFIRESFSLKFILVIILLISIHNPVTTYYEQWPFWMRENLRVERERSRNEKKSASSNICLPNNLWKMPVYAWGYIKGLRTFILDQWHVFTLYQCSNWKYESWLHMYRNMQEFKVSGSHQLDYSHYLNAIINDHLLSEWVENDSYPLLFCGRGILALIFILHAYNIDQEEYYGN